MISYEQRWELEKPHIGDLIIRSDLNGIRNIQYILKMKRCGPEPERDWIAFTVFDFHKNCNTLYNINLENYFRTIDIGRRQLIRTKII